MKLNLDCCRDILFTIEAQTERMHMQLYDFLKLLPQYSELEIEYCLKNYMKLVIFI